MAARANRYTGIDQHIAANLRTHRETGSISQEELAQRMTDRGFGFTQATIWKIENGQRPVKASELVALAHCLEVMPVISLTYEPGTVWHLAQLQQSNRKAHDAYETLKEAAAAYCEAQLVLLFAAREAHDNGITVTGMHTSWLDTPPEEAVIEARLEAAQADAQSEQIVDAVDKVLDALRATGYDPSLRIEAIEVIPAGSPPVWSPPQPTGNS
jgi:transcriptional regulator with XRE-family HTH domain